MRYKHVYPVIFPIIFLLSLATYLIHTFITKNSIFADGRFYYSYTRSLAFDQDINLINDFELFGIVPAVNQLGLTTNTFPPGSAMLWFFSFWQTKQFLNVFSIPLTGVEFIFQLSTALVNITLGTFGFFLIYLLLETYHSDKVSKLTILTLFLSTNLFFYIAVEPINSHALSFFTSSLFAFYFFKNIKNLNPKKYLILGLFAGFAGSVRTQDSLLVTLPVISSLFQKKLNLKTLTTYYSLLTTGFLIGFLPQIYLWKIFYNFYFPPPGWGYGFTYLDPKILYVLFNNQNGLFTTTPIILFLIAGLFLFKKMPIFVYSLIYLLLQLYFTSAWRDYTQGGSFSIRMLITTYPFLSFGLASVIEKSVKVFNEKKTFVFILFFAIFNFSSIIKYLLQY